MKSRPSVLTQALTRPRDVVDCLADDTLMQTRPDHAAARRRLSSHFDRKFIQFHVFGSNKLIREFSDKGFNVKSINKLLKKVRHSGSMRRRRRSSQRRCVRSDASLVFTRYSTNM